MRSIIKYVFVITFCFNQLHIIDAIVFYAKKYTSKEFALNNNLNNAEEEDENEEHKKSLVNVSPFLKDNQSSASITNKIYFIFQHPIYSIPFIQKEIEPPNCA
jgi:hypothetical protein